MAVRSRVHARRLLAGACALALAPASLALANPSDSTYRLVFADEFNGSSVDTSKWLVAGPSWTMPNSLSTASAGQVSVANGQLTLNAVRTGSSTWSSGSVSTYGKYNFAGGYVEARIQLPSTPGSWPAFWGLYNNWPPEADIMEYPLTTGSGGLPNDQYNTAFHYATSSGNASGAGVVDTNSDMRNTWHTFAMDWSAGTSVKFLLDGVQKSSFSSSSVSQMANMYMILDYAVGGWPGTPSTSQWAIGDSDQTKVDWVRVWQKNGNNDAASTWNINGNGSFSTGGNWTGAGVPKYGNQTAVFGRVGTAATSAVSMPTWTVFGGMTFDGLASGTNAGTTAYTIGSSGTKIQLASTAGNGPVVQATANSTVNQTVASKVELWNSSVFTNGMTGGQTLSFNSPISGNGGLTVTGVGATVLNAANTYAGGTTIGLTAGSGVLRAAASGALGTGGLTFDASGNGSTARLELTGGITLANNVSLAGRNNTTVAVQNLAGNNTLSGTITTNTGGSAYIIQSDAGLLTLAGNASGATAGGVAVQAGSGTRAFTFQGAGDGLVSGKIQNGGGTVAVAKAGLGTWTLSGTNTFTGNVNVTGGKLVLANTGAMAGLGVSGGGTLAARGNLASSAAVAVSGGAIDTIDGTLNTVSAATTLTLANSTLNIELGNGTTTDKLAAAGAATVSGTNTVNLNVVPGQSIANGSAYTIVTAAGGLNAADFAIGAKPARLGFYDFTLSSTGTALRVTATGNPTPAVAYFTGAGSAAVSDAANNWGAGATVSVSNWSTNAAGTSDALQVPGSVSDVVISATNATGSAVTTQLDAAYAVKGLTYDTAAGILSATVNTNGNPLTIGADGVTLAATSAGSGFVSGTGGIVVSGSQTWANQNSARWITVNTPVAAASGATTLSFNGTGAGGVFLNGVLADGAGTLSTVFNQAGVTTLAANNTYTGTTTVTAGTVDVTGRLVGSVVVGNGGTLRLTGSTDNLADAASVNVQTGGTLDLRNATPGVARTETVAGLTGGGTVTRSNAGLSTLTVGTGDGNGQFGGSITNGAGTLALAKVGTGTLMLTGPSNYTGGTTIADNGGELLIGNDSALGNGPLTIGGGASEPTGVLQLADNITVTGVPTINLASRSTLTNDGAPTIENIGGSNTLTANLNINNTGGTAANIVATAGTLTLTGNLGSTGLTSARGFDFGGGGTGVASGTISNGTAQPTFVQKDGNGAWTLAGNNTYTGGTVVNGGTFNVTGNNTWGAGGLTVNDGVTTLGGSNTYTGNTTITGQTVGGDNGGSLSTGGRIVMASPTALGTSAVYMSGNATLEVATDGGDRAYTLNVGTNNIVNLVSGTKTGNTGINHTLGALFIGNTDTVNVTASDNVAGGSPSITLGNVTLSSGFGAGSTTFNPTTASLKLGAVSTSTSGAKVLVLDGTATGNAVTGAISNNVSVVSVVKSNTGTWQLSAAGTYTGGTTINDNGGALLVTANAALGSGTLVIGQGGTNAGGKLQLAGNTTINSVPGISVAGRNAVTAGGAATIENVSGNNTVGPGITFNNVGGTAVNVVSAGGQLLLAGPLTAATVTGSRGFTFSGAGNGTVGGAISNGSATIFVQKSGAGTWTLAGNNTYTGVTTVAGGELRATAGAYNNFLSNAGGVDITAAAATLTLDYTGGASPAATLQSLLTTAAAGNFAGGRVRSSTLAAGQTVGFGDNGTAVTVRVTLPGDADLDGDVDFGDFVALQSSFGQAGTRFDQGNFNYDGATDFGDFVALQTNFGQSITGGRPAFTAAEFDRVMSITSASQVPEPATLAVTGVAAAGLLRRRRNR